MSRLRSHVLLTCAVVAAHRAARLRDRRALDLAQAALARLHAENRSLREEIERLRRDPVTGVLLRLAWTDAAAQALPAMRDPVLLLLDVNNLKPVNDTLGHAAGDRLLQEIVQRLLTLTSRSTLIGRLGGDEFAVLLDVPAGPPRQYLHALADACVVDVDGMSCGAAFGAARPVDVAARDTGRRGDSTAEAAVRHRLDRLLHAADLAMYRAKRRCHEDGLAVALEFYGRQDAPVPARFTPAATRVRDHGCLAEAAPPAEPTNES